MSSNVDNQCNELKELVNQVIDVLLSLSLPSNYSDIFSQDVLYNIIIPLFKKYIVNGCNEQDKVEMLNFFKKLTETDKYWASPIEIETTQEILKKMNINLILLNSISDNDKKNIIDSLNCNKDNIYLLNINYSHYNWFQKSDTNGYKQTDVSGDGNCFYYALYNALKQYYTLCEPSQGFNSEFSNEKEFNSKWRNFIANINEFENIVSNIITPLCEYIETMKNNIVGQYYCYREEDGINDTMINDDITSLSKEINNIKTEITKIPEGNYKNDILVRFEKLINEFNDFKKTYGYDSGATSRTVPGETPVETSDNNAGYVPPVKNTDTDNKIVSILKKQGNESNAEPGSKPELTKSILKQVPKFNYPVDNTPITVPNTLVIYLMTNVPGFQKVRFMPYMVEPKLNKYVDTVYFDPIIPLNFDVIKKTPRQLEKTQFFDKGLFFTLKNRTLTDFWRSKPVKKTDETIEKQLEKAKNNGTIEHNIRSTINTLFKENSVIYLNNKPYTIYSCKTTPGDWKIDTNNNLPGFLSTGQYYGPYSNYQGGPASPNALNRHPMEQFRQPTIYITNNTANQSSPLQIQNAEKQLSSIPRNLIAGPTLNEKEFSNIPTIHQLEWKLLPATNKPQITTIPVEYKELERNRYNPNLPQILPPTPQNNPLLLPNGVYNMPKPDSGSKAIENSPYQSIQQKQLQNQEPNNNLRITNEIGTMNPDRKRISIDEGKNKTLYIENNNRNLIPVNPSINNQKLIEQLGGAESKEQQNIKNFFMNFYNQINILYRNMTDENKHFFEYILNNNDQIVECGNLPDNLRIKDYCCNSTATNSSSGTNLNNIFIQPATIENSFFDCISAGIDEYNNENKENKINCYKIEKQNTEATPEILVSGGSKAEYNNVAVIDKRLDNNYNNQSPAIKIKMAVFIYFQDHPDEYNDYINTFKDNNGKNIHEICDKMNDLFEKMIDKNKNEVSIPNDDDEYKKKLQELYNDQDVSIKTPLLGINIPTFEKYRTYDVNKQKRPFEIIEMYDDKDGTFLEHIRDTDFLVNDKIIEIIRKKYGMKVIIIEKISKNNSYHIKNRDIILKPGDNSYYPPWNKYMFLLLDDTNGHYDLLNFVTRKSYWCYIKDGIKMTPTTIFSKEEQNYIWNVPPVYIIYLMFVTCYLPKLIVQSKIPDFIKNIDLFRDDYIIFSNVFDKIKNVSVDEEELKKDLNNIENKEKDIKNQIKTLTTNLETIEDEYGQEYNKYVKNTQDKYLNEIIANNPTIEKKINKEFNTANKGPNFLDKLTDFFNKYLGKNYGNDFYVKEIDKFQDHIDELDKIRDDEIKFKRRREIADEIKPLNMNIKYLNDEKAKLNAKKENIDFINNTFIKSYNSSNNTDINVDVIKGNIKKVNDKIIQKKKADEDPDDGSGTSVPVSGDGSGIPPGAGSGPSVPDSGSGDGPIIDKEAPPPEVPPPPLDELDILNDKLKNDIIGAWKEVSYDKDPSKKYWWNEITNETTSIGAPQPTGLTATTPKPGFMSYDSQLKENSKTSFIVFVNLVLYPGTSIPANEKKKLACYLNYEEIRRSYAELWNNEYIPIPMNDPSYYKLDNDGKSRQTQKPSSSSSSSNLNKNTTTRRVSFNTGSPQRIQGGKNKTKRNDK